MPTYRIAPNFRGNNNFSIFVINLVFTTIFSHESWYERSVSTCIVSNNFSWKLNSSLEHFTNFLCHENLELYNIKVVKRSSPCGIRRGRYSKTYHSEPAVLHGTGSVLSPSCCKESSPSSHHHTHLRTHIHVVCMITMSANMQAAPCNYYYRKSRNFRR